MDCVAKGEEVGGLKPGEQMPIKTTPSDKNCEPKTSQSRAVHQGKLNPALEGKSLNQVLDDLYVEDYLEKAHR